MKLLFSWPKWVNSFSLIRLMDNIHHKVSQFKCWCCSQQNQWTFSAQNDVITISSSLKTLLVLITQFFQESRWNPWNEFKKNPSLPGSCWSYGAQTSNFWFNYLSCNQCCSAFSVLPNICQRPINVVVCTKLTWPITDFPFALYLLSRWPIYSKS